MGFLAVCSKNIGHNDLKIPFQKMITHVNLNKTSGPPKNQKKHAQKLPFKLSIKKLKLIINTIQRVLSIPLTKFLVIWALVKHPPSIIFGIISSIFIFLGHYKRF